MTLTTVLGHQKVAVLFSNLKLRVRLIKVDWRDWEHVAVKNKAISEFVSFSSARGFAFSVAFSRASASQAFSGPHFFQNRVVRQCKKQTASLAIAGRDRVKMIQVYMSSSIK